MSNIYLTPLVAGLADKFVLGITWNELREFVDRNVFPDIDSDQRDILTDMIEARIKREAYENMATE